MSAIEHPFASTLLARVLLVDSHLASRLALQTILEAAGYSVQTAPTADEALERLNREEFELVLSELDLESPQAGLEVLAYARMMDYQPATAVLSAVMRGQHATPSAAVLEDVPNLIDQVAQIIGERASRSVERLLQEPALVN
jgi:CheY-like chemotaxis protein